MAWYRPGRDPGLDDALGVLMCSGMASHRGDWRSIAESVESLPEDRSLHGATLRLELATATDPTTFHLR